MKRTLCSSFLLLLSLLLRAQDPPSGPEQIALPPSLLDRYARHASALEDQLSAKTQQCLQQMEKAEARLIRRLHTVDSVKAKALSAGIAARYRRWQQMLKDSIAHTRYQQHIPLLDSVQVLARLQQYTAGAGPLRDKLTSTLGDLQVTQLRMTQSALLEKELTSHVQQLSEHLKGLPVARTLQRFKSTVGIYQLHLRHYKVLLSQPDKAIFAALQWLRKQSLFQNFFRRYSVLQQLLPPDPALQGIIDPTTGSLQTRSMVLQTLASRVGSTSAIRQALMQQTTDARSQINGLRLQAKSLLARDHPDDIQGTPNPQQTKTFLQRIELGTNFQNSRSTNLLPAFTDFGLSIGYRLNPKSVIGVGGSYKLGWGESWRRISLSSQGASIRSFIDWKIKGSWYCTGGYELHYQPIEGQYPDIKALSDWQRSGLFGLSKTVAMKTKFLQHTKVQLLWDLLSYHQVPRTSALKIRFGYQLK